MLRAGLLASALGALLVSAPSTALANTCNLTTCADATVGIQQYGTCVQSGSSWRCPWRVWWTASGSSSLPGSISYNVSTPGAGHSNTCSWTTGSCYRSGEMTGWYYGVYCAGMWLGASIHNVASAGVAATASDSDTVLVDPPC